MERLPGRTLEEADMHRDDTHLLLAVAQALAALHQLPLPPVCDGEPMLWRTVDKMLEALACRPELMPDGMPGLGPLLVEVLAAKAALAKHDPKLVSGHGDFKPSNVMEHKGRVKLIDFELGGPNYRGFDLFKIFRTAMPQSEASMAYFMRKYLAFTEGETVSDEDVSRLMAEIRLFEPLTWLEACIFFLILPQFKPERTAEWAELAKDRWTKYQESGQTLFLIKKALWLWAGIARVPLALCTCEVVLPLIGRPLASLIRYFSSSYRLAGGMWQRPVI